MRKKILAASIALAIVAGVTAMAQRNNMAAPSNGTPFDEDLIITDMQHANPGEVPDVTVKETGYKNAPATGTHRGHGYVDLGLSVCWATVNVGERSGDSGSVLAWGMTKGPAGGDYSERNCDSYGVARSDISGNINLDIAAKDWGGNWRMPTKAEMQELRNNCTWVWVTSPIMGYKVTSKKNGRHIYLPAWGRFVGKSGIEYHKSGYYWTSTPCNNGAHTSAYRLDFSNRGTNLLEGNRRDGCFIRPVLRK